MADKFKACSVVDCNGNAHSSKEGRGGFCRPHYRRMRRHGDPLGGKAENGEPKRFYKEVVLPYEGDECIIWPYNKSGGYGQFYEDGKMHRVHRRLCEEINGPPPTEDHQAAHSCGKGKSGCVTKSHISWKTPKENNADKITHGTSGRGESHNLSKLTEEQVVEIRSLRGIEKIKSTASRYGVSMSQVSRIQLGYNWGWLKI